MRRSINASATVLVSRLRWYSRLAQRATGVERAILDARRVLIVRTLLRSSGVKLAA